MSIDFFALAHRSNDVSKYRIKWNLTTQYDCIVIMKAVHSGLDVGVM